MIYDIINPSDPYTLEADDFKTACLAACLLGGGKYGLESADKTLTMPILLFGLHESWFPTTFGKPLNQLLDETPSEALAAVLDTVLLCTVNERKSITEALSFVDDPVKRDELRDKWHNERRGSLNDIGGRARDYAAALRR